MFVILVEIEKLFRFILNSGVRFSFQDAPHKSVNFALMLIELANKFDCFSLGEFVQNLT